MNGEKKEFHMAKIMEIIEKETRGKSYHTYKYSYDSIGLPSIDYDDDPNKIIKWKDSGETGSPKNSINLKQLADQLREVGEPSLFKYFLTAPVTFLRLMILHITSRFFQL